MAKEIRKLAAGLLSLVLALCVLTLPAVAEDSAETDAALCEEEEGISPHYVECPSCGGAATVSTTWQPQLVGEFTVKCEHYRYSDDIWAREVGQTMEKCTNSRCGWYDTYDTSIPVFVRCAGTM